MNRIVSSLLACSLALPFVGCRVQQTEEGEAPRVDVEPGSLPEYDVDTPTVDVGERPATVTVPDVEVQQEERRVTVPQVDLHYEDEKR